MRELQKGFSTEVDAVDERSWYRIIQDFDDASLYQTWAYDSVRCGTKNLSHLVLIREGHAVAAAQARILRVPVLGIGIAYIRWGPLWKHRRFGSDQQVLRLAIRALHNEYACRRGLLLRLYPVQFRNSLDFLGMMREEGFTRKDQVPPDRTLLVDLNRSLEDLRKGLKQKWRNQLNAAERNDLEVIDGDREELFRTFTGIYSQMVDRKRLPRTGSIEQIRHIQKFLPDDFKLRVFICRSNGTPCAGAICSPIGETGIYLFGATNETAMKNKGSYLLQWKIIEWLKRKGCKQYDLNGINPVRNPGTYTFKAGLCGSNGRDLEFQGVFDACRNLLSQYSVRVGDMLKSLSSKAVETARRARG